MDTYVAKIQIGNNANNLSPIASTMFGVCSSNNTASTKVVTFNKFDKLIHGVTIFVKFINGNSLPSNLKLQVNNTLEYDITGDCICGENEIIAFTFDEVDATHKYWRANSSGISSAMKEFIINTINTSTDTPDVLIMKGSVGTGGNPGYLPTTGYETGWTYRVVAAGTYVGQACQPGDLIIAITDASSNQSVINNNHWLVLQSKNPLEVSGPANAVNNHIAVFDGVSGKVIKDSGYTIETSVPSNAVFTDTTYSVNEHGLQMNNANQISIIYGNTASTVTEGNDPRLSDARTPLSHIHGNINNNGELSTASALVVTNANKEITTGVTFSPVTAQTEEPTFLRQDGAWAVPNYALTWDDVQDKPSTFTPTSHTHGKITNNGYIQDELNSNSNALLRTVDGEIDLGPSLGSNTTQFLNNAGNWAVPPYPVTSVNGDTGDIIINASNIGINPMHFIGQATVDIYEGTSMDPRIAKHTWPTSYTAGDVILGYDNGREYILDSQSNWILLGQDASTTYDSNILSPDTTITNNTWIARIQQSSDRLITATMSSLDTSGTWEGDATKLGTTTVGSTSVPIYLNLGSPTVCNTYANGTQITLNSINYAANDAEFFAPTTSGTQYQILVSGTRTGYTDPQWAPAAKIQSLLSTTQAVEYTTLTLGNSLNEDVIGNSKGQIVLYSANIGYHVIDGANATQEITHTFYNSSGYILQSSSSSAVGGTTQPIYINSNGIAVPITYVPNRIYYGEETLTETTNYYIASGHFINSSKMAIGSTSEPLNEIFYVNGQATIASTNNSSTAGALHVLGGTCIEKDANIGENLIVTGTSKLTDNVGIGTNPETGANAHILTVNGNSYTNGTSTLLENVGIGTTPDNDYILKINGSILFANENINLAYFQIPLTSPLTPLSFYPYANETGYIGIENHRWYRGYFSNLLEIGEISNNQLTGVNIDSAGIITIQNSPSSIVLNTNVNNNINESLINIESTSSSILLYTSSSNDNDGQITIVANTPTILLDTLGQNQSDWIIKNTNGIFSINNQISNALIELSGTNDGFELTNRLYINETIPNSNQYTLYIGGGDTYSDGNIIPSLTSNNDNTPNKTLGSVTNGWSKVYIGSSSNHGNPYIPIYWNDGVPTPLNGTVQYKNFSFTIGDTSITLTSPAYDTHTCVLQIVVTSGIENLNGVITSSVAQNISAGTDGQITLTTIATSGTVTGYILTSYGYDIPDESASSNT